MDLVFLAHPLSGQIHKLQFLAVFPRGERNISTRKQNIVLQSNFVPTSRVVFLCFASFVNEGKLPSGTCNKIFVWLQGVADFKKIPHNEIETQQRGDRQACMCSSFLRNPLKKEKNISVSYLASL